MKNYSEMDRAEAEQAVKDAENVLRAEYWQDVRALAESFKAELADRIKDGESGEPLREWLLEHITETIDGNERVIYTWQAQKTVLFSENDGAYIEEFGTDGLVEDGGVCWSRLAYGTLYIDVMKHLGAIGVDVNNPGKPSEDNAD